jgi:regulatory protein
VARSILLATLAGRPRTRAELADVLASRLVPPDVATRVLDRFEQVGLVDDQAFARAWVESRHSARGLAAPVLAMELRRKGVPDDVAREALAAIDPDEEESTARLLVRRRLRSLQGVPVETRRRRLAGMLARKGYPSGLVAKVLREEVAGSGPDGGSPDTDDI